MKKSGAQTASIHAKTDVTIPSVNGSTNTNTQTINADSNANINRISANTETNVNHIRVTQESTGVVEINATTSIHTNSVKISATPKISDPISIQDGSADDHRALKHLDYESSGHTGFASSAQLEAALKAEVIINSPSGTISQENLQKLKSNFAATVELDGTLLNLVSKSRNNWTYASAIDEQTGDMTIVHINIDNGAYNSSNANPAQQKLDNHKNDTEVHLQAGERPKWNNKVSAEVEGEKLKLEV